MTPNYPNHPLFRIAPVLDRGFQRVDFDPYERVLVGKIRAGQYVSDLFDCNSLYLNYSSRLDAHLDAPRSRQGIAIKSRYKMTPEERKTYLAEVDELHRQDRAERAKRDAELKAEKERIKREAVERRAAWEAEQEGRAREWEEEDARRHALIDRMIVDTMPATVSSDRVREMSAILKSRWDCSSCLRPAKIFAEGDAYILECRPCRKSISASHAILVKFVLAREAQHQLHNLG